ncbi:SusC/RagA family TonB-linked outer membrane protein [Ornithobacterium rhinotracheale]
MSLRKKIFNALALCCVFLFFGNLEAQQITGKYKDTPIKDVLKDIENQTDYSVIYDVAILKQAKNVTTEFIQTPLESVLKNILGNNLGYSLKGEIISIFEKNKKGKKKLKNISGKVVDSKGNPVIGAELYILSTGKTINADFDGAFIIDEIPEFSTIIVSEMGHEPKEIKASKESLKKITLETAKEMSEEQRELAELFSKKDTVQLNDIVVVGYGAQRKGDLSTSVSSVKAEDLVNSNTSDFRQALSGKMAGVQVTMPSGDPEGPVSIKVRGTSTINAGNDPLYVVDGVPMQRGMGNINSNDIESIEVLKDASAAAIYGSRGSNGVILITTKSGKGGKLRIDYSGYYGVQSVSKKLPMMNAYEFAEFAADGHNNAYLSEVKNASSSDPNDKRKKGYQKIPPILFPYLKGEVGLVDTDWQDAIFRDAYTMGHNLSFSGSSDKIKYFLSAGYMGKEGVILNSDFQKFNARMNLSAKYNKLKFGVNFAPSYSKSNRVDASDKGGIVQSALMMPPIFPVYNEDGSFNYQGNGYLRIGTDYQHNEVLNPVAIAVLPKNLIDRFSVTGKLFASYDLLKSLNFKTSFGGDFYGAHNDQYTPSTLPFKGKEYYDSPSNPVGYSSSSFFFNWLFENQLTYDKRFGKKHKLNTIFVQSMQKETFKYDNVRATDYPNDYITVIDGGTVIAGSSNITEWTIASYLSRAQYNYDNRYLLSLAIRADGSSRFGKNKRWGYFPSASAAWNVSKEKFFKRAYNLSFINNLKLRASYGVTGNFQIGNYEHLATMSLENYILGDGSGSLVFGYKPDKIENKDLGWEKNKMVNGGLDLHMFNHLLDLTVDYYYSNTENMLLYVPVPLITGYSTSLTNIGKVNNKGIELGLSSRKKFNDFSGISFNANWSKNINKVISLGETDATIISSGSVGHAYYITEVGKPIGNYYLPIIDGVFKNEEELNSYPHLKNAKVGDFKFRDVDGDKVIDLDKDRAVVGNYMPDFTYGFGGKFWYKNLDFSFNFQGVYGNEILNLNKRYIDNLEGNFNGTTIALDRWKSADVPGNGHVNKANRKQTGSNGRTSTWHIEDGSYLRLQNVSIGYTFPEKLIKSLSISKLKFYFTGQNLLTISKYSGYNPEVNARPGSSLTPGEDYGTYPLARTLIFGVNLSL